MPEMINQETRSQLANFVDRLETLYADRRGVAREITDVFKEAETAGFDKKALRVAVKLLNVGPEERAALTDVAQLYVDAISTPSGN
jgi:Uncharacterized protein conserved in bacteria